ncbi:hypothetical protein [Desulfovibrio legallii]|uniref:Uncharacterized protein n=1 Tax=Desulfovibrio legallii TaxID=571438 RepID=A0A1G7LXJ4_9BACT|nr:hypothetical protein [Desulfovibrio legallii]SDF54094.1 hypothetical protein SAMN05192586_10766 [Desulfovibrio legallii]
MPQEQEQFRKNVDQVLEAVMFENWLRFYFISEKPDADVPEGGEPPLFMAVPVKSMERISELYPHLLPLADAMNGKEVAFETSRQAVCQFVLEQMDGKVLPRNTAGMIFGSAAFQVRLQLFNTWVQMHEAQLDRGFLDFDAWRKLFTEWTATPAAKELGEKLSLSFQSAAPAADATVQ